MECTTIVTKAELARRIGRTPARVSQLIRDGRLAPPALLVDGRIDLDVALAQLAPFLETASAPAAPRPPPAAAGPMAEAKLRLAQAQAEKAEADLEAARGVHRRDALIGAARAAGFILDAWTGITDRCRADLVIRVRAAASEREAHEVAKAMDQERRRDLYRVVQAEIGKVTADLPEGVRREVEASIPR